MNFGRDGNIIYLEDYKKDKAKFEAAMILNKTIQGKQELILNTMTKRTELLQQIDSMDENLAREINLQKSFLKKYKELTGSEYEFRVVD